MLSTLLDSLYFWLTNTLLFYDKKQTLNFRAIFVISLCLLLDIYSIIGIVTPQIPTSGHYMFLLLSWGAIAFFVYRLLYDPERIKRMSGKAEPTLKMKIIWNLYLFIFFVLSIAQIPSVIDR